MSNAISAGNQGVTLSTIASQLSRPQKPSQAWAFWLYAACPAQGGRNLTFGLQKRFAIAMFCSRIRPELQILIKQENEMSTQRTQRRAHFSDVKVGERFYDLISAEYFIKQSEVSAVMVTGIGDGVTADEFEPDDVVRIEE
jgi:hypothetical protein